MRKQVAGGLGQKLGKTIGNGSKDNHKANSESSLVSTQFRNSASRFKAR